MLREEEIQSLVARIVARLQPQKLILFGSYAKGTATIRSDVDFLVVKETDLPMARRAESLEPLLARALVPIDVHVYTPEEIRDYANDPAGFIRSALRTGRTMFDRHTQAHADV